LNQFCAKIPFAVGILRTKGGCRLDWLILIVRKNGERRIIFAPFFDIIPIALCAAEGAHAEKFWARSPDLTARRIAGQACRAFCRIALKSETASQK
jgi:hypothetical protein